jgi:hypothetical protein
MWVYCSNASNGQFMKWSEQTIEAVAKAIEKSASTLAKEINQPVTTGTNKGDGSPTINHADWYAQAALTAIAASPEIKGLVDAAKKAQEACSRHWFSSDGEEDYNNDDIIEADELLKKALLPFVGGE